MGAPEIHPARIYKGIPPGHDRLATELLSGHPMTVEIGGKKHTASALDIISIPPAPDSVLLEQCASMLQLSPKEREAFLAKNVKTLESEALELRMRIFAKINQAAAESVEYNLQELFFDFRELYDPKKPIKEHADIVAFMRKTSLYREDSRKRVLSANYCQLLCDVVARYEILKKEFETLIEESNYVHDVFYARGAFQNEPRTIDPVRREGALKDNTLEPAVVYLTPEIALYNDDIRRPGIVDVLTKGRGKRIQSAHSKAVRDPLVRASEAGKDSIGDVYECSQEQGLPLMLQILSRMYGAPLNAKNVIIENDGFFSKESSSKASYALRDVFGPIDIPRIQDNDLNVNSGGFTALKIRAEIETVVPSTGEKKVRDIEIQIVPKGNKNNVGLRNWHVYQMVRKIAEVTRKRGAVPMRQFEMYLEDASNGSGIPKETILQGITDRIAQVNSPTRVGVSHIIAHSVYNRMKHIPGLVSEGWMKAVLHAMDRAKTIHLYQEAKRARKLPNDKK